MARMPDSQARAVLREAFALRSIAPTLSELQGVQAVTRFEGGYGGGWKGAGVGSNNWGAVQCGHYAPCAAGCFEYGDTHADGKKYRGCFRIYASPAEGAADVVRELYRRDGVPEGLRAGDATRIAERMRATGYFEAPADRYAKAIETHAAEIAGNLGETLRVRRGGGLVGNGTKTKTKTKDDGDGVGIGAVLLFAGFVWGVSRWKINSRRTTY